MIYLDNSATTKPYPEVLDSFQQVTQRFFGNPSSLHHVGTEADRLLLSARQQLAQILGTLPEELVFTSGGTEGNNTAIKGIALEHQNRGKHIITTQVEHPSVIEACEGLEKIGFQVTYLPVDSFGRVDVKEVEDAITDKTILISIMHVNNEMGTIQPVEEIGELAKRHPKLFFHVDYVQGLGKVPLQLSGSGIDLCTISGHKVHGLKGTGLLYIKKGTRLFSLMHGGGQEKGYRSGTENLAGAVSLAKAVRITMEKQADEAVHLLKMKDFLWERLSAMPEVIMNTPSNHAPHIINVSLPGYKPEVLIHALGEKGIYISTKSACASKLSDESAVLAACGLGYERSISAIRISLSYQNNINELKEFHHSFSETVQQLSGVMG